ncbi:MAG: type IV secretion system DNA-binding domain-containing protein [Acidobacteriota bacterium]|nr:type IV secretion system DNA-binding domain-containing protein [Acidobacteriota bacterium]
MNYETTYIGNREIWGGEKPFGISRDDRRQHLYAIGKTGTGKTTLLRNLICQDIERGHGVGLIDPHGDLAEEILDSIPSWRADDVLYFNPADTDFPIGFNLVCPSSSSRKYLETSAVVGAFKHFWRDSWGPRLEYVLYAGIAALMECQNVSLLSLPRMLTDPRYRRWVVEQVKDPMVRNFWEREFTGFDKRLLAEIIAPIQNKVGQLLMAAPLRNVFGQVRSRIDPRFIMDNKRIFIANLAKGRLGEDKSNLLGSLLISKFQTAAMERSDIPEEERTDFYLYIDEFPNFSTDSFAGILSEARKYRLNLILAHQYVEQMREEVRDAVFGNVGSIISFRVGESDAQMLAKEFGSHYSSEQFTELANHEIRAKILQKGEYGEPCLGKTAPPYGFHGRGNRHMKHSRQRFGTRRDLVESKIRRWMGN